MFDVCREHDDELVKRLPAAGQMLALSLLVGVPDGLRVNMKRDVGKPNDDHEWQAQRIVAERHIPSRLEYEIWRSEDALTANGSA